MRTDSTTASPPSTQGAAPRLGDDLAGRGLLSEEDLAWALAEHERTGERLGAVLLSAGLVRRDVLHQVLAESWGCDYVDLRANPPEPGVADTLDPGTMAREGWVPVARRGGSVVVATSERPTAARAERVRLVLGADEVEFVATSDWDLQRAVATAGRERLLDDAAYGLVARDPVLSAVGGAWRGQWIFLALLAGVVAVAAATAPIATLVVVAVSVNVVFLASVGFKIAASVLGWTTVRRGRRSGARDAPRAPDDTLPVYTLLVPLYGEAQVLPHLIASIEALDYPAGKLQVLLLMEEQDHETIAAARAALGPGNIRIVVVPDGVPRTKPRACNVGLFLAQGEFLVIFDAEDRPEPGQLRQAVAEFRAASDDVVCLQARLNYFNRSENVLTRMFTLEYSYWFDDMLPGLDRLGLPIPLGGTSNHFRVDALRALGGWDAFNVTEDADLGVRASQAGKRVGVISSTTYEEACMRVGPWIRQRTRWIKGYIQTAVVHTRRPIATARSLGPRGTVGFLLLIAGTPLTFLIAPVLWAMFLVWLLGLSGVGVPDLIPSQLAILGLVNLVLGNGLMVALNGLAVVRRRSWDLLPFALLAPLYWILHSLAAWRAVFKLVVDPHSWEKTPHGLTAEGGEAVRRHRRLLGALRPAGREVAATGAVAPTGAVRVGTTGRGRTDAAALALVIAALAGWALMLLDRRTP